MRAHAFAYILAIYGSACTSTANAACKPLVDIIAEKLSDPGISYEIIPFALVSDLTTFFNAIPPKSEENFDGAVVRVTSEQAVILLTRGADVCGSLPPIPAPAWAVLHKRIFGTMA